MDDTDAENSCAVVQTSLTDKNNYKGKHRRTSILSGKGCKNILQNKVMLLEKYDKYDLELRFKPRHRQHTVNAKIIKPSNYGTSKP